MKRGTGARGFTAVLAVLTYAVLHGSPAAAQSCTGDCPPQNMQVAVNELIVGVNIALGGAPLASCPSYDADSDSAVGIGELVSAVSNALDGCPGEMTPTPMPTSQTPPTATWTPAAGPAITFFSVTNADGTLLDPAGATPDGIPIFAREFGLGFNLVVEADGMLAAPSTFEPGAVPALQIQATNALGNGSTAVCDVEVPPFGGVPAVNPPQLENPEANADVLNDFGCRFIDGTGNRVGRSCSEACVRFEDGEDHCVNDATDRQFCAQVDTAMRFPTGDTLVSVRVRDVQGRLGNVAQLIVRVAQ